jgi:diguanylate cyclase (GGDEF)-like protein
MTQKLPVTRDGAKGSEILLINSQDAVMIWENRDQQYIVHTPDQHYVLNFTPEGIEQWLYEDGFRHTECGAIVKINQASDLIVDLPSRSFFEKRLQESILAAESSGTMVAVILFGLDRFKQINDTFGHTAGDKLLSSVGHKLYAHMKDIYKIARFGGDKFMVLLTGITQTDEVVDFVSNLSAYMSEPFLFEDHELQLTSSMGISIYPQNGQNSESLIEQADIALYKAKESVGNTFTIYDPDMKHKSRRRLHLEMELRKALERKELLLFYQPLVDLQSGHIFGMEALLRWEHPNYGIIPPGDFIPLAEETGLIIPLGNWVLERACRQNQTWSLLAKKPLCVSVNISAHQIIQPGFVSIVESVLQRSGLPGNQLCLELTESIALKNTAFMIECLNKLRHVGVQISIDDFGTGYSSLSYLKHYRVNTLKIDQSFIRDLSTDEDNTAIVSALISLSKQLKINCLAEGVETQEQLDFLIKHGCNQIQGHIFSKPLPSDQFEQLLHAKKSLNI